MPVAFILYILPSQKSCTLYNLIILYKKWKLKKYSSLQRWETHLRRKKGAMKNKDKTTLNKSYIQFLSFC